jgi:hypothetical protein
MVPLHIFVDLGLVLGDNALIFLDEVATHTSVMEGGQYNAKRGDKGRLKRAEGGIEKRKLDTLDLDLDDQSNESEDKGGPAGLTSSTPRRQYEKVVQGVCLKC